MESPNAPPAHDFFTPAWLKLPDPQLSKKSSTVSPSSQSGADTQHKGFSNTCNKKDLNNSTNSLSNGTVETRERIAINFHDSSQPYLRHNPFESESHFNKPNLQTIGTKVNGFRSKKYIESSQRATFRPIYREKGSIAHHSNPKPNRNIDTFKPVFNSPIKKSFNKSTDYLDNDSTEKSANSEQNCNVFNQEFPSLVDTNGQNGSLNNNSSAVSAWSNNASKSKVLSTSKKFQLIHSSVANFDNIESNKSDTNSSSKPIITSSVYRNISLIGKSKTGIMKENAVYSRIQPMITKTSAQTTPAMEILVKNPKKRSTNKMDFLNSIRSENKDKDFEEKLKNLEISSENRNNLNGLELKANSDQMSYENDIKNDQNINNYICRQSDEYDVEDMAVLSSSLEAEHRLLLELGWKAEEDDDPSYAPLTEDEVNEFKDLINARNVLKRNTTQNTSISNQSIHLMSPKKWPMSEDLDDESSSSSDDD